MSEAGQGELGLDAAWFACAPAPEADLPGVLAALFADADRLLLISDDTAFLRGVPVWLRLSVQEAGLDREAISDEVTASSVLGWIGRAQTACRVIVDMRWLTARENVADALAGWSSSIAAMTAGGQVHVLSVYRPEGMIEWHVEAVLRAHRSFLSPSGLRDNPFHIPVALRLAPRGEQLSYLLGRVVPELAGARLFAVEDSNAARGAAPEWVTRRSLPVSEGMASGWRICCLGQLRVYGPGRERIDWKVKGGAPKKTKTLFAYLLTCGEKGAHADQCTELLWPEGDDPDPKRARLHHTVAMLRRTLGHRDTVLRTGDFYRLNPPEGTWTDITIFEQLCRRGMSLSRNGRTEEALAVYRSAERLYAGDLFQDIPLDYVDSETEDWCLPRRRWLREVAIKLQIHMSRNLRQRGRLREALEHCHKGLAMEAVNEEVTGETLRVLHAQGRLDAVARQYRQYKAAVEAMEASVEGSEVQALYRALTSG